LENELGRILKENVKRPNYYKFECPFGKYQRADAIVSIDNRVFVRIEAKYINEENAVSNWKYKNFLEWSTKYRNKPRFFYPYTLLYINYDFYKVNFSKIEISGYRNKLAIVNFRTLPRMLQKIEEICRKK
jgi:hypothetical protein